jgi:hypothetical protein
MASDQKQQTTYLWQQRQQDEAKHGKVFRRRPKHAARSPCYQPDCCVGLRVGRLPDARHRRIENLTPFGDRGFAFATELPHAAFALPVAGRYCICQRGLGARHGRVTRDARTSVTSLMLVEAKPMPAVTAKTKVTSQTIQATSAVAR